MEPRELLEFYSQACKLKLILRHVWLGVEHRKESVADHSWGLILLACMILPYITGKLDHLKVLKMLAYHDLAEVVTGDIPSRLKDVMDEKEVYTAEKKGLELLTAKLPSKLASEIIEYWEEFESTNTLEAKVAVAIDKIEVILQHDLGDLTTWGDEEFPIAVNYKDHYFDFNPYIRKLKDFVNNYNYWLTEREDKLNLLPEEQQKYWAENKSKFNFEYIDYK